MKAKTVFSIILLAVAYQTEASFAATISTVVNEKTTKSVEITCTGSCEFWDLGLEPHGFSDLSGDWLYRSYGGLTGNENGNGSNSNFERRTFVENVLGTTFELQSASSDVIDGVSSLLGYQGGKVGGWTGSAQYYLAWGGFDPRFVLIKNNSANNVFSWNTDDKGSGLSGIDGFGSVSAVPLPAAGLLMLISLCAVYGTRRRIPRD
ncbi:hypothetical protein [Salipiger mangrovisoli]|uniref:VPLPA-CTERM protein sorting domain-containing protein n=1 Tax=Salipiger mangrovisoli TaxID=2865933 RepID=A0ABR9X9Z1_9RHOB|nr:hypothetical protein [Salipiger mangrovisoli]MBE9640429.1 hypothetical protein [Salipiger mangrovisoli]